MNNELNVDNPDTHARRPAIGERLHVMRLLVTGGTGVLGRALRPLAEAAGHEIQARGKAELDLFDRAAVAAAARGIDAVLHLATRIQPLDQLDDPAAWVENDRL
jgi:nucleoside-diphosphate-sugar epimerase